MIVVLFAWSSQAALRRLAQGLAPKSSLAAQPAGDEPHARTLCVALDRAQQRALAAWSDGRARGGGPLLLLGSNGSGRSTAALAVAASAAARGERVLLLTGGAAASQQLASALGEACVQRPLSLGPANDGRWFYSTARGARWWHRAAHGPRSHFCWAAS